MDKNKLQKRLQKVDNEISLYALAHEFGVHVDEILLLIQNEILPDFQHVFKSQAFKIPFFKEEEQNLFFRSEIIDLGFLCQHKIKEVKEHMKKKHSKFAHQIFYDKWLLSRGY